MKIAISAAEPSADLLAAKLITELRAQNSNISIQGMAGDKMLASGCVRLWNKDRVSVMGFGDVIKKLVTLIRLRTTIINYFLHNKPDIFIGVDAPDFNFAIERRLKQAGIKTVHFISPSIWAWRQWRIKKIKESSDLILCLFPFEVDFYKKHKQKALFVGHPLAEHLIPRKNHVSGNNILLMPGSRNSEIKQLLPEMLNATRIMVKQYPELKFHLVLANSVLFKWASEQLFDIKVNISIGDAHTQIVKADLVLVASGTATLEVALIGVPMVVVYKLSKFNYYIIRRLIKSRYIALPNILTNKLLVPELIQKNANAINIAKQAIRIMTSDKELLIKEFNAIHSQLKHNASAESAKIILKFANEQ